MRVLASRFHTAPVRCSRVLGTQGMEFLFCGNIAGDNRIRNPEDRQLYPVCNDCWREFRETQLMLAGE